MKTQIFILFTLIPILAMAQNALETQAKLIEDEGKMLYYSEKASWHGSDIFMAKDKDNIGGYLSYPYLDSVRCIFFSKGISKVIFTATFEKTFDLNKVQTSEEKRNLSSQELDLLHIKNKAITALQADTIVKYYSNTNLNIIPIINGTTKRVYVLTGPDQHGAVLFGNDYLVSFDKLDEVSSIKPLHKSLIPIKYNNDEEKQAVATMHTHLPEMGEFITSTDICTLMLYQNYAKWEKHYVVSENYVSIWNCTNNSLKIITKEEFNKKLSETNE